MLDKLRTTLTGRGYPGLLPLEAERDLMEALIGESSIPGLIRARIVAKLARDMYCKSADNMLDIAGYAILALVKEMEDEV